MDLSAYTALAALAVVGVEQVLKILPLPLTNFANRYPAETNIGLSILASLWVADLNWTFSNWRAVLVNVATISVVAALTYNQLVNKTVVKDLEAEA